MRSGEPGVGVIGEEGARGARGSVGWAEGIPGVKHPIDDRPDLRAMEESMGDVFHGVRRLAGGGGAVGQGGVRAAASSADMSKEGVAADLTVKDPPSGNGKGGV